MQDFGVEEKKRIIVDELTDNDKFSKNLLDLLLLLGSIGFLLVGISSFIDYNILFFINADSIVFFPQGLVMSFYGFFGLIFSLNQIFIHYWKIGQGYNVFNKVNGEMIIHRLRYPLAGDNIYLVYKIIDIVWNKYFFE